jgi:hypothetical protein
LVLAAAQTAAAQTATTAAWTLKVSVEEAAVRLGPDLEGPVVLVAPKGLVLKAYEARGAWFRVLAVSPRDGTAVIGYLATSEVEILEEKPGPAADFWPATAPPYHGLGLIIRLSGGLGLVSSPDVDASTDGMAALGGEAFLDRGYSPVTQDAAPLRAGPFLGFDALWALTPRLAVGAGFGYSRAARDNSYTYNLDPNQNFDDPGSVVLRADMYGRNFYYTGSVLLRTDMVRLSAAYTIPLSRAAGLVLTAGPALYRVQYVQDTSWNDALSAWRDRQDVRQTRLGAHASLALEINLNNRVGMFFEALGRLVRFSGLTGTETFARQEQGYSQPTDTYTGDLYFIDDGSFSRSLVRAAAPPGAARKMIVAGSGLTFVFGFRTKF